MVFVGCSDNRNEQLLTRAEAYMETRADSARWLLQQVDSVLTDEQQARYALLWTQAMHKCHIPLEDDSLINVAVDYYSRTRESHRLAKSLLYKGLVHKQHGEVELATKAFVGSEQAFEGVEDDQYKALLFGHYASLMKSQNLLDEALRYFKRTYSYELKTDSVHYIVSSCSDIAAIYELMGQKDSAQVYYVRGLSYTGVDNRNLLHNYALHLMKRGMYADAENMLKESETQISESVHIYNVYSSLATLYYETKEYEKAKNYGERMLESTDSMMQCTGYLHLYRAYKQLGDMKTAVHYHDLYRQYDSDITLRKKTAKVAEIPHKMKALRLETETRTAHRWQWGWGIGAAVVLCVAVWTVRFLKRKHGRQLTEKDSLLDEKERMLALKQSLVKEIEQKLYDLRIELGRMKGVLANQSKTVANLKEDRRKDRAAYNESVKEFKKSLRERDEEYRSEQKAVKAQVSELTKRLNQSEKEQNRWGNEVKELVVQMEQYELWQRFLLDGENVRCVLLILELKSGRHNPRYSIKRADYAELLKQLAEYVHPGIRQRIETDETLKDKQELACLLALGLDSMEMLRMATNLKPNSVRTYCTQVRTALSDILQNKVERV